MNFLKTFIISLVIYMGLNAVFTLIAMLIVPGFPTNIMLILNNIFTPIFIFPGAAWSTNGILPLLTSTDFFPDFMLFLGLVVPPLVTVIVASFLGDRKKTVFRAWILTALITCIGYALLLVIGPVFSPNIANVWAAKVASYGELGTILVVFAAGIANGLFYSGVAYLITKEGL
jgi:hypothetical protein